MSIKQRTVKRVLDGIKGPETTLSRKEEREFLDKLKPITASVGGRAIAFAPSMVFSGDVCVVNFPSPPGTPSRCKRYHGDVAVKSLRKIAEDNNIPIHILD